MNKTFAVAMVAGAAFALRLEAGLQCAEGQTKGAKTFTYHPERLGMQEAQAQCASQGGWLAVPENAAENDQIQALAESGENRPTWVGLYQANNDRDDPWTYVDGTTATEENTFWDAGQPQYNGEHCTVINWNNRMPWHDLNCASAQPFVCMNQACEGREAGWHMVYQVISEPRPWAGAEEACQQWGGHLASIINDDEQAAANAVLEESGVHNAWIGAHQVSNDLPYSWVDGTFWNNREPWRAGEPNDWNQEDCVEVIKDANQPWMWNDHDCVDTARNSLCSKWTEIVPVNPGASDPDDVVGPIGEWDDGTFFVANDVQPKNMVDHAGAVQACLQRGGHLASVLNEEEQAAVAALAGAHGMAKYWIGGNEIATEGTWRWEDQSEWSYEGFMNGQPSNWGGRIQECLSVWRHGAYGWRDNMCDLKRFPICKHFADGYSVNTPL